MTRAKTTTLNKLDETLVEMQNNYQKILQIFPCPIDVDFKGDDIDGYCGNFGSAIVIIYIEGE